MKAGMKVQFYIYIYIYIYIYLSDRVCHADINSFSTSHELNLIAESDFANDISHNRKSGAISSASDSPLKNPLQVIFGAGLSPVPSKLVKRIEDRGFIELSDLLPERLATIFAEEDQSKSSKSRRKHITSILEWVQCFGLYTVVKTARKGHRPFRLSITDNWCPSGISRGVLDGIRLSI